MTVLEPAALGGRRLAGRALSGARTRLVLTDIGGYGPALTAGEGGFRLASRFSRLSTIPSG